jgi:hypothetical protein
MRLNSTGLAMRLPEVKGRGPKKLLGPEASKAVKALLACDQTPSTSGAEGMDEI